MVGKPLTGAARAGLGFGYAFVALQAAAMIGAVVLVIILAIDVSAAFGIVAAAILLLLATKLLPRW